MKVVAYSFNGVQPIDSNNTFTSEVLAAAPGKKYILMCEAGGTMRQSVNFPMVCLFCGGGGVFWLGGRGPSVAWQQQIWLSGCVLLLLQTMTMPCLLLPVSAAAAAVHVCLLRLSSYLQGKPSRSLQAAFKLMDEAGLSSSDVAHLERGVYGWYQAQLPMVGE